MSRINVLAVDDVEENLIALSAVLADRDLNLLTARSGTEALELLLEHPVALALVDVKMPGMSGFELAELMRGAERTRHVPIIFITAGAEDPNRIFKGYEAGAVDFLFKPVETHLLRSKVDVFVELHRQRLQLAEQLEKMEQMLRLSDLFVAVLGHDLRNPLAGIQTNASLILSRSQNEAVIRAAHRVRGSADRMNRLIQQVLDFARARLKGAIPVEPKNTDLAALCRAATEDLPEDGSKRLVFEVRGDAHGRWDPDRMLQVLSNLLGNALKHGAENEPVVLAVDGTQEHEVVIDVCNGGVIPDEARQTLFEPFRRGGSSASAEGLGLGLFIVDEIVRSHGGTIDVTSEVASGTRFRVRLKRVAAPVEAEPSEPRLPALRLAR